MRRQIHHDIATLMLTSQQFQSQVNSFLVKKLKTDQLLNLPTMIWDPNPKKEGDSYQHDYYLDLKDRIRHFSPLFLYHQLHLQDVPFQFDHILEKESPLDLHHQLQRQNPSQFDYELERSRLNRTRLNKTMMTCVPNGIGTKSTIDCFYDRMTGTSRRIMTPGNVYTVDVTYEARLMTSPVEI